MARNTATDESTEVEGDTVETTETPAKAKKAPLPDGWITPVTFAKELSAKLGRDVRPQIIYGYIKNSKDFPHDKNTDGHVMVHRDRSFAWYEALQARKAEREAKKAATPAETTDEG